MDLKSLFQGRPLLQFKTFAALKLTRSNTEKKPKERTTISRRNLAPNSRLHNGSIPAINKADSQRHKRKNKQKVNNDCKTQTVEEKCERSEKDIQTAYARPDIDAETRTGSAAPEAAWNVADMFPRDTHWFVSLFTLVFRVWYVSRMKNWWILHPDEIYQTLEGNYFNLDSNACCMC